MSGSNKKRFREGALRAQRTPEDVPAPSRLVPVGRESIGDGDSTQLTEERTVTDLDTPGSQSDSNSRLVSQAVTLAKEGDARGLHFLYVRFASDIQRYVASVVHDHHEAEDITQNLFAKLTGEIKKYDAREVPFTAWIMRVARNAALAHMRARRAASNDEVSVGPSQALNQALEQLPDDQREVIVLRHVVGLSPLEIAATLERSESSVHGLHHRGHRVLQTRLDRFDERQHELEELLKGQ